MRIFRMHGADHPVFDTTGTFLQPGRWHSAETRLVYAAEHVSLAVLETLIHTGGRRLPPRTLTTITLPDTLLIEEASWLDAPASKNFGDTWAIELRSALLRVPSIAVNRAELNYILRSCPPCFSDHCTLEAGAIHLRSPLHRLSLMPLTGLQEAHLRTLPPDHASRPRTTHHAPRTTHQA